MPTLRFETALPVPREEALAWHARPGALERMIPPWESMRVVSRTGPLGEGGASELRVRGFRWLARHHDDPDGFADELAAGPPFTRWRHRHRFADGKLVDEVTYSAPIPMRRSIARAFAWRHRRLVADLAAHATFRGARRLAIGMTGASGFLGSQLCAFLTSGGHEVRALPRRPTARDVAGLDAVVHLAGETISQRWSAKTKREILESRTLGTRAVAEACAGAGVRTLLSASAIGIYGDRGDERVDEASAPGDDFLARVCVAWEEACAQAESPDPAAQPSGARLAPAHEAGVRVANLRTGIVLSPRGGALQRMLLPFRVGAGGPIGPATQWMSWIGQDDWTYAAHRALLDERVRGPVNLVAGAVRNRDFVRALGRALRRPAIMPLPSFAVRALFGEMGDALLLSSQRVEAHELQRRGHAFAYPTLEGALAHELGA